MNKKILPFHGSYSVSQKFGNMDVPDATVYTVHNGTDYLTPHGTPELAMDDGKVVVAGPDPFGAQYRGGFGNEVQIAFTDGTIGLLGHMSRIDVQVNQQVKQGQQVGLSGNSGFSTGPHTHVGLNVNGVWVDPELHLVSGDTEDIPTQPFPDDRSVVLSNLPTYDDVPFIVEITSDIGVRLRVGPGKQYDLAANLPQGIRLPISGIAKDNDGIRWGQTILFIPLDENGEPYVRKTNAIRSA